MTKKGEPMDNNNLLSNPQEFIDYLNTETQKVFDMFSTSGGDDVFTQFAQSWTELANRSWEDPTVWIRAIAIINKVR